MDKTWTQQNNKVRRCLHARVCSYPVLRSRSTNVPGQAPTDNFQRLNNAANAEHT